MNHPKLSHKPTQHTMINNARYSALDVIQHRPESDLEILKVKQENIGSFFGSHVFNDKTMEQYLPDDAYLKVKACIQSGNKLTMELAEVVAQAMKKWAQDKGATHYAHWFQPLTGKTAEKHDSFFSLTPDGKVIEEFGGKELAQQEPDGSSFPGGGLRSTFEARGYTAWDPSSPAFILEVGTGKTLCIPTILVTYTGEALDYKLPLLKSQSLIEQAAIPVCKWFDVDVTHVMTTLGWEQEYFLVDEALYNARPDLVMCGRTLIGKLSVKGQQLEDHYFGSIPERMYQYMRDLETECHKLGIPLRTRHNEVGPAQYEFAPMFEDVNIAVDHNSLLMDLMDRIARRHKLRCILHEKPFLGVNGSGKHNNWSMSTNTGKNLLSPGNDPGANLQFLTFFVNTIAAVHEHADLLRASIASPSNDHRLGANEAPPAIVSVFIGKYMSQLLDAIAKGEATNAGMKGALDLISKIPNLVQDNTDRNRTSPFAFTGNKFEIRMVGSSANCAAPMTILNTMMAQQLNRFRAEVEELITGGEQRNNAILTVLKKLIKKTKAIRFEGDNYSEAWAKEAASRGLSNFKNTPEALDAYISKKSRKLFQETGLVTERELNAHYEVRVHNYVTCLEIESQTLEELCYNYVIPASVNYLNKLTKNYNSLLATDLVKEKSCQFQKDAIQRMNNLIQEVNAGCVKMKELRDNADKLFHSREKAGLYCNEVKPCMDDIRECCDELELLVSDDDWALVKYRELMFMR